MVKEMLAIPAITIVLLSYFSQMSELAENSADKAVDFAEDMNKAIDCATEARELSECSPNLFSQDFKEDIEKLQEQTKQMKKDISGTEDKERLS